MHQGNAERNGRERQQQTDCRCRARRGLHETGDNERQCENKCDAADEKRETSLDYVASVRVRGRGEDGPEPECSFQTVADENDR